MKRRRGAGPRSAILALLDGAAEPLASGAALNVGKVKAIRWPSVWWRLMASAGWPTFWRHDTVKWGQVWTVKVCGSCPTRRTLPAWRRLWAQETARMPWRRETAVEWSARTGEWIPDYLREL